MITYICGSMIKYSQFPNEFLKDLDALMKDGDEILLGDSDFDHRVYGRFTNKQYRNVSVIKEGPVRKRWFYTRIESFLNSCISMVKKCDRMIAVWDGESPDAYINILLLLSLHKTCRMYYLPSGKCIEIKSVDDLISYVPERHGWTKDDIEAVLRTCGLEDQMVAHMLENFGFSERFLTEIIGRAPIPIKKKLELMEKLLKKNNLKYETFTKVAELIRADADVDLVKQTIQETYDLFGSNLSNCISAIHSAENGMKHGMYYLFSEWYDLDVFFEKSYPIGMFDTFKKAVECIKREEKYEQDGVDDDGDEENLNEDWWKIEAWYCDVFDKDYEHTYNYYIYKDEVCWFECLHKEMHDFGVVSYLPVNNDFFGDLVDLDFDTPFKCGDIVRVDCRPFGPPFNALIIEGKHQYDGCFPQVLFTIPYTDKWDLTSLKYKRLYKDAESTHYCPHLSPLYRLRSAKTEELTETDEILVKISNELEADEDKGSAFWNAWPHGASGGISAEEVLKTLEKVKKERNSA